MLDMDICEWTIFEFIIKMQHFGLKVLLQAYSAALDTVYKTNLWNWNVTFEWWSFVHLNECPDCLLMNI